MKSEFFFTSNLLSTIKRTRSLTTSNEIHISEAMNWLLRAQNITSDGGISNAFHMYRGWLPSYPETTGYIIETFLDYYYLTKEKIFKERALEMAKWLISIQYQDGAFPDTYFKKKLVFDTGQILFGLVKAYEETKEDKYKKAAIKAGEWLINEQEDDGSWVRNAYNNIPHTYYARVAWSLLSLHKITLENKYITACKKNIDWVLSNQNDGGWFNKASFDLLNHHEPFTHTTAYVVRGILESGVYLNGEKYVNSAVRAMDNLMTEIYSNGFVCGTYDRNWKGNKNFSCLTGNAQLAIILFKIAKIKNSDRYFNKGCEVNQYLKSKQNIKTNNLNIRGAIAGSYPIWGKYLHFTYPNWAAKFFVDSLLLENSFKVKMTE